MAKRTTMATAFQQALRDMPDDAAEQEARLRSALIATVEGLVQVVIDLDAKRAADARDEAIHSLRLATASLGPQEEILDKMKDEA